MDGDVWPPFYELPFARSGVGHGLGRAEPVRPDEVRPLVLDAAASSSPTWPISKGLVLLHQNYFQHNILEAGAHWADFPWRSANNVNNTGFPEPPPYANNKRIFQAHLFYDVTHPVRRPLHEAYIRQCLSAFADNTNVIQSTSDEFTGPVEFVQFWLDTIASWEKQTGKHPLVALSCTKDVQDAILADARAGGRRGRDRHPLLALPARRDRVRPRGRDQPRPAPAGPPDAPQAQPLRAGGPGRPRVPHKVPRQGRHLLRRRAAARMGGADGRRVAAGPPRQARSGSFWRPSCG